MCRETTLSGMRNALAQTDAEAFSAELHLQIIRNAEELAEMTGAELYASLEVPKDYCGDLKHAPKVSQWLGSVGLNPHLI